MKIIDPRILPALALFLLAGCGAASPTERAGASPFPDPLRCQGETRPVSDPLIRVEWCEKADGRRDGPARAWHPNQRAAARFSYYNGVLDGAYESWADDGAPADQGRFTRGEQAGDWTRGKGLVANAGLCRNSDLEGVMARWDSAVQSCYAQAVAGDAGLTGRVWLEWTIDRGGHSRLVKVRQGADPALDRCIAGSMELATFAPAVGGVCAVDYKFKYRPPEG